MSAERSLQKLRLADDLQHASVRDSCSLTDDAQAGTVRMGLADRLAPRPLCFASALRGPSDTLAVSLALREVVLSGEFCDLGHLRSFGRGLHAVRIVNAGRYVK